MTFCHGNRVVDRVTTSSVSASKQHFGQFLDAHAQRSKRTACCAQRIMSPDQRSKEVPWDMPDIHNVHHRGEPYRAIDVQKSPVKTPKTNFSAFLLWHSIPFHHWLPGHL